MRVGIAIAARRKIADRRGVRVGIVKCANGIGAIAWRWIGPMTAAEVRANLVFQSQFQKSPNPAKPGQRKSKKNPWISFDFLCRIEPFQWVTPTPRAFFLFLASFGER
jgi:hypothetical protein